MKLHESALLIVSITLTGCGTMPEERAVSGAGIGAATGAIVGAVTSLAVGPGALIGALGGGLVGAMTNKGQINMGEPAWKHGSTGDRTRAPVAEAAGDTAPVAQAALDRKTVASVQGRLAWLGYDPGPVDGIVGRRTAAAIRRFQADHGLEANGLMTAALADQVMGTPKTGAFSI